MNCYISVCDVEHFRWGDPRANRWWEPLSADKVASFERIVEACGQAGVDFCFSMNPGLFSKRLPDPADAADMTALWRHYAWMQGLGVRWFNLSLDDVSTGIDARTHARLANELLGRLRVADPDARLILCPAWYWGDGSDPQHRPYLETLARELDAEAYVFWTGDGVVTPRITRRAAESYRAIVDHRLFVWDNYPVNDDQPTMHLGPVTGRAGDLGSVADGYLSNAMCRQSRLNVLPLATCADYAYNPGAYDPTRSIGQAILRTGTTPAEREVLRDLVEAYPGMLRFAANQYFNPVRARARRLAEAGDAPDGRGRATRYLRSLDELASRFTGTFGGRFPAERQTLEDDVAYVRGVLRAASVPR